MTGFKGRQVSRATNLKKAERTENKILDCFCKIFHFKIISFSENNSNFGRAKEIRISFSKRNCS